MLALCQSKGSICASVRANWGSSIGVVQGSKAFNREGRKEHPQSSQKEAGRLGADLFYGIRRLRGLGFDLVCAAEFRSGLAAHVTFQNWKFGLAKIYDHQAVQYVGKLLIYIETQQPAADLGVLA